MELLLIPLHRNGNKGPVIALKTETGIVTVIVFIVNPTATSIGTLTEIAFILVMTYTCLLPLIP